jgi:hypothetical protein
MKKTYKNLTGHSIKADMYGIGIVVIPEGISEQEEHIIKAFQGMTPVKLFEECGEEEIIPKKLEELTNKELRALCVEQHIECSDKDTKGVLISKLRGE